MTDPVNALASPQFASPTEGVNGVANALGPNPYANMMAAMQKMKLTPQEQALYLHHLNNLQQGGVQNPDGSVSTLYQVGFSEGNPQRSYNVPSIYGNTKLSPDAAIARAQQMGLDNFPSYGSDFAAENRYQQMHNYLERDTANFLASKRR